MRRRYFLVASGIALSGCLAGGGGGVPSVDLSADDTAPPDPDISLAVAYNSTVVTELPTDPPTQAEDGHKWLLVRVAVTNQTDDRHELAAHQFKLDTATDAYEQVRTDEDWALAGREGSPGDTAHGWLVFHPAEAVTEATLTVWNRGQTTFAVTFTHDSSLDTTLENI